MTDFNAVLKNKNFVYLWISQILSQLTINIMNFLLLIRLFNATGSTIATSFLWIAYALPAIFIGPIAAATVDLIERRKILIVTNLLQSITVLFYVLVHQISPFIIYGIVWVYSFLNQFYVPAESASLPSLVKKENYPHANSLFFITQQISLIVGFGIAGVLNALLGFRTAISICAILLFLAFVSTLFLPRLEVDKLKETSFEKAFFAFFRRIEEGYNFIKNNNILLPFLMLMILQISLAIITVNIPQIAKELFDINVNSAGIVLVVPAGIGALLAAISVPKLLKKGLRKKTLIESGLMLITLASFILIFLVPLFSSVLRIVLGMIAIVLYGLAFLGILIPTQTYLQEITPGGLRGRVFGNFWFLVTIATVFPLLFSGTVVELFGAKILLFLFAMISLTILVVSKNIGQKYLKNI